MKDYQTGQFDGPIPLTETVSVAMADIAATMREGLLAMAVGAGMAVMRSLMVDGVHFAEHLCVVAMGIGTDGT
jgi:hypothetical protein